MKISQIIINNFRNYNNTIINLKEGVNVVIGPNNAGKTNFLKVVTFLNNRPSKLKLSDFNHNNLFDKHKTDYKENPPKIEFYYVIEHSFNPDTIDSSLIKLKNFIVYEDDGNLLKEENEDLYKIKGKFKITFELDNRYWDDYKDKIAKIDTELPPEEYFKHFENTIEDFLDKYEWFFYNDAEEPILNSSDVGSIFNIDFIPADRTTDKLLPETKAFIKKKIKDEDSTLEIKRDLTNTINNRFKPIINDIKTKFEKGQEGIGIVKGNNILEPSFKYNAPLEEHFQFHLIDKDKNYNLPLENNGLGYNNLIQIYNILQFRMSDDYNILLIEEPEAHLHPAMQYQLFKYLQNLEELPEEKIKNQIIITTHSPNISASSNIDDVITLHYCRENSDYNVIAENLKTKFTSDNDEQQDCLNDDKKHIIKFLDVTRSDMLFTEKVILVEGLSEKLLLPLFAQREGFNLVNEHISVVEVGGINFRPFLNLFKETKNKILCIRDCDVDYLKNYKKYEKMPSIIERYYKASDNINIVTQRDGGSTFESEIFIDNFTDEDMDITKETVCKKLLYTVLPSAICTTELAKKLCIYYWYNNLDNIVRKNTLEKVKKTIEIYKKEYDTEANNDKKAKINKLFFADLFLLYAKNQKGAVALDILMSNFVGELRTPEYIKEGLEWLKK
jgi:predicted ATP-dependent endonuclease of OLD family